MINDSINRFLGVLCYPFASLESFWRDRIQEYLAACQKPEKDRKEINGIRESLQNELVGYIRKSYPLYSYDEIYLYLERSYLYDIETYEDALELYRCIMERMASTLLSHRDGRMVFKYWENKDDKALFGGFAGSNKVILFHSLNCHIPMDVIAIVYMIRNQREPDIRCLDYFYGNIEVADQQLSRILEKGVAENHLHKGVSRTFSSIWDSLMEPLTVEKGKAFLKKQFISGTREQNKQIQFYILGCGVVRGWMILSLQNELPAYERECLKTDEELREIRELAEDFCHGENFEKRYRKYFADQQEDVMIDYFVKLWEILERFLPEGAFLQPLCMGVLAGGKDLHTFDENVFLYYALQEMFTSPAEKRRKCIMQYLRIRNYLFYVSVQQKTVKGLDYFQQIYRANSKLNRINIENFWESAIREQLQNRDLRKLEFRSSIKGSYKAFKKDVMRFLEAYKKILEEDYCYFDGERYVPAQPLPQVGLVIHFLKRPDETVPEKCFQNGREDCSYFHFGKLQEDYENQIEAFVRLRSENREMSRYLVGIDAASLENSTPTWVFTSIYEKARDSRVEAVGRNMRTGGYTQSLGFTFHAGEDFRHILSGLRRIDEAVEYLKFHAGDRIGHGIALGISAQIWKSQNPVVIIPQIEALENYLWAYDTLSRHYSDFQAAILAYMEQKIYELAGDIYGENHGGLTIEMLISSYHRNFGGERVASEDGIEEKQKTVKENLCKKIWAGERIHWDAGLLTVARHCKNFIKKMEQPIHYAITEQDLMIIEELQAILKKKLGRKGIVIEVNPSSNTAIADLDVTGANQFYEMNRMYDEQNLIVCVNSDDPAVFNTNVSNELAYIYYGMLERDISREAALRWLDQIRKNGMDSSFIRRQESDEVILEKLAELLADM
ncbi:MAG: hypothetical protein HFG55_01115 [Lachnospiraceae bacterium]|nr:hypothetical protein [Lachnospiraceae bacterium]